MSNFYLDVIKRDSRFNDPRACHDLNLLEPNFRQAILNFIADAKELGHILVPVETFRSSIRQRYLYSKHLTQLKNVGVHNYGLACDLALMVDGDYDPKGEDYEFFLALCEKNAVMHGSLISGIDWGRVGRNIRSRYFHDWDHVQYVPVWRQSSLFAGTWYPPSSPGYNPYADKPLTIDA